MKRIFVVSDEIIVEYDSEECENEEFFVQRF